MNIPAQRPRKRLWVSTQAGSSFRRSEFNAEFKIRTSLQALLSFVERAVAKLRSTLPPNRTVEISVLTKEGRSQEQQQMKQKQDK